MKCFSLSFFALKLFEMTTLYLYIWDYRFLCFCSVNGETQNSKHQALTDLITSANNSNNNESPSFTSTCKLNQTQNYNDESETSSGFDDDDTMNTTSNLSTNHDLPVQVHSETDLHQVNNKTLWFHIITIYYIYIEKRTTCLGSDALSLKPKLSVYDMLVLSDSLFKKTFF